MKDKLRNCIDWLRSKGVDYADCRFVRCEKETIHVTNGNVDTLGRNSDIGVGIRVLADGCWGFAATMIVTQAELQRTAARALQIAKASLVTKREAVRLADQETFVDHYESEFVKDPFEVATQEKLDLLLRICESLQKPEKIRTAQSWMIFHKTKKLFVSTEGALIEQDITESGGGCEAVAVDGQTAQKRSDGGSIRGNFAARGYEFIEEIDLLNQSEHIREEAVALLKAKPCPAKETTIIIGSHMMALQIHECCGHPSELDRVLGSEISLAGGSFMTLDKLNKLRYGSKIVNITADATTPGALGTFGYDDEGVKAQRTPIVRDGLFVGYLTSRETAPVIHQRSNGAMRAESWNRQPLIRMTNINLEPGEWELDDLIADTKEGVLFDANSSVSIDDQRLNFQFGAECAWEIKNGKLGQILKDPVYSGITPQFWNSCDAICNQNHWRVWGIPNCGKGEPMQVMHLGHGVAPARFRNVQVGVSK